MSVLTLTKGKRSSFSATAEQVYTCCCGLHVQTALQLIAAIVILLTVLFPLQLLDQDQFLRFSRDNVFFARIIFNTMLLMCEAFCAVLVFAAVRCQLKKLLLPFMYWQYFSIALCVAMTINFFFDVDTYMGEFTRQIDTFGYHMARLFACLTGAGACLIFVAIRYWVAGIVKRCFQYLADIEKASKVEKLPRY